ncbi:acyl-CoA dehydrogenase family protein [Limnochorda pilosa]|uniref:Butyryl-CoA dehydrogenase n=1 Tax=Limnochorda pilosa TaxID=1555112 RepID=A0A0K2SHU0_LIMPI|nr:acyl-CoA dehydrogenase family protein [Limnochorda pilosa]BAS26663.1 butyryl-CoA dehydrogenase [Limnochorda pilosa]
MNFELSEDQRAIQQMVREFAQGELMPRVRDLDREERFDPWVLKRMGELGILGLCLPRKYQGGGMDYLSLGLACEELEYVDSAFREILSVHTALVGLTLMQWATLEQKERFLVPMATGAKIAAFGLTEPGAGSDVAALESRYRREGDAFLLSGDKLWISLADVADLFLVFARRSPGRDPREISAFLVERGRPGLETETLHHKLGVRAGNTGGIHMREVRVPAENLLGQEGEGFKIAMSALDNGRLTVAAGATGMARACLEASVRYAKERETFGRPIAEHQLVQQMIARMVEGYESSRLLYAWAASLKNQGKRCTRETSLAKLHACDAGFQAAADAVEIHGAYGFSDEFPVSRHLRNAKGEMIYEGTREIHLLMQAGYALGSREDRPLRCSLPPWPFPEDVEAGLA